MNLQNFPVWYQPEAPLGSLIRYLAGCSGRIIQVSCSIKKNGKWKKGPGIHGADLSEPLARELISTATVRFEIVADTNEPLSEEVIERLHHCIQEWENLTERG